MAVDTSRGEKLQSHKPKMLEDGKKVALIGGVIVHFGLGGGNIVTFGWQPLVFCSLPNILKYHSKVFSISNSAISDSRRAKACVGKEKSSFVVQSCQSGQRLLKILWQKPVIFLNMPNR